MSSLQAVVGQTQDFGKDFGYEDLTTADLFIDAVYRGGTKGNAGDDPLNRLLGGGNQGGFRYLGSPAKGGIRLCILYTDLSDPDWPDTIIEETGTFIYYGDNKRPGHDLHDTPRQGNLILKDIFDALHTGNRHKIPPIFVFSKGPKGRDVVFRGLAIPGAEGIKQTEDLVAVWKSVNGKRFQNYRATFTLLDEAKISREWLNDLREGRVPFSHVPTAWASWIKGGAYRALKAERSVKYRKRDERLPADAGRLAFLEHLIAYFKTHPNKEYAFEGCAARLIQLMDVNVAKIDLTRPWKDGGRDALGKYRIGPAQSGLMVDFAVEAKCWGLKNGCGVRATSRLISRLRHRQFGIFITTSFVDEQAYSEILEDEHPVLVLSGRDIVDILFNAGISTIPDLSRWLEEVAPNE